MTSGYLRPTITSAAVVTVLVMVMTGCTTEPFTMRESARPVYMDAPGNTQREDDAASAAVEVLRKFSGESPSKERWLRELRPLVTPSMAHQILEMEPPHLKPNLVHAAALEQPQAGAGEQVRVRIGTDAGEWTIVMTRAGLGSPWLAADISTAELT